MPVLDTVVLFAALSRADPRHRKALKYMEMLGRENYYISASALIEMDIVLKSRGYTHEQRMKIHALLAADHPEAKTTQITPTTLHLAAKIEKQYNLDYFDALVAAEALQLDATVVSTDTAFNKIPNLKRKW